MSVISGCLVKMEMPKVEIDKDTSADEESWEGLRDKSEDGGKKEGKGKNAREDLVSDILFNVVVW